MPKQLLDGADIRFVPQHCRSAGVAKRMAMDVFLDAGQTGIFFDQHPDHILIDRVPERPWRDYSQATNTPAHWGEILIPFTVNTLSQIYATTNSPLPSHNAHWKATHGVIPGCVWRGQQPGLKG